jgi:hypothetical protein
MRRVKPPLSNIVTTDPDPTEAVKEALTLAVNNLDEKFSGQIQSIHEGIKLARVEMKDQLAALSSTIAERFLANKDLVDQLSKANASALAAALLTQKEGAAKDTAGTGDLLRQLQNGVDSANKATNEKIDRLTSRLDTGEGSDRGGVTQRTQGYSQLYMIIIVIIAAAGIIVPFLHSATR